jgi:hypothetical protein
LVPAEARDTLSQHGTEHCDCALITSVYLASGSRTL